MQRNLNVFFRFIAASGKLGITSFVSTLVSFVVGVYEHVKGKALPGNVFIGIAALTYLYGAFKAWKREEDIRIQAEKERDRALDHDRPEVFAGLEFGPGPNDGVASVFVHNLGPRDALNVQIQPIILLSSRQREGEEIEINKEITFPNVSSIARNENSDPQKHYLQMWLDGECYEEEGMLGDLLSGWCSRWGNQEISIDLHVIWTDASGNQFTSSSKANYSHQQRKCRTMFGQVTRMSSSNE